MYNKQGTYAILLIRLATDRHTHTQKEMDPVSLYSASQPRRERRAGDQSPVGTWPPHAVRPTTARVGPVVCGSLDGGRAAETPGSATMIRRPTWGETGAMAMSLDTNQPAAMTITRTNPSLIDRPTTLRGPSHFLYHPSCWVVDRW